jgi:hypothetical protein
MRKLIVSTFLTLDGVMQAPGGPREDDSGGFAHGGWSVNYWEQMGGDGRGDESALTSFSAADRYIFAAYWPQADEADLKRTTLPCGRERPLGGEVGASRRRLTASPP